MLPNYLFSATPILGFKLRFFEPFFSFWVRFSQVFMLIPMQFDESQMESAGISAKTAVNKSKMSFFANPILQQGAENKYLEADCTA